MLYLAVGSECQSPSAVEGMKFSDAFGVIDCALSSTTILSTQVSYATQVYIFCQKVKDINISKFNFTIFKEISGLFANLNLFNRT